MIVASSFHFHDSEVVELAFLAMLRQILSAGSSALHLIDAISQIEPQNMTLIFSGVIRLWLECIQMQVQTQLTYSTRSYGAVFRNDNQDPGMSLHLSVIADNNIYDREKRRLFQKVLNVDSALYNIIKFSAIAARRHRTIRFCMLDAGALSLVIVAFVNADFLAPSLTDLTRKKSKRAKAEPASAENGYNLDRSPSPIPSDVIQTEASTLSVLMHSAAFRATWQRQQFNDRRHLCSLLVRLLLGDFGESDDDKYVWTRALFWKILA